MLSQSWLNQTGLRIQNGNVRPTIVGVAHMYPTIPLDDVPLSHEQVIDDDPMEHNLCRNAVRSTINEQTEETENDIKTAVPLNEPCQLGVTEKVSEGYGKPPIEFRFAPGISGNICGRPKGAKNKPPRLNEMFSALAARTCDVDLDGKSVSMSFIEALGLKMYDKAYNGKGDARLALWIFKNCQLIEASEEKKQLDVQATDATAEIKEKAIANLIEQANKSPRGQEILREGIERVNSRHHAYCLAHGLDPAKTGPIPTEKMYPPRLGKH
jgi:Family of unknown function (DUF5681)